MRRSAASGRGHQEAVTVTHTILSLLAGAALVATVAASMDATKGEDVPVHFKTPTSLRGHHDPADHIPDISHPHSRVEDADDITWANLRVTPPEAARRNPRDTNVTTPISLPTTLLGGRFVTFSLNYGRTFNRVRSMLNLLELAIILNRTAILPGFDDAGRENYATYIRFDDALASHVRFIDLPSFLTLFKSKLTTPHIVMDKDAGSFAKSIGLPSAGRTIPTVRSFFSTQGLYKLEDQEKFASSIHALVDTLASSKEAMMVLSTVPHPWEVGVPMQRWVALPHFHFSRAIEDMGREFLARKMPQRPWVAIHSRFLEKECPQRSVAFQQPLEWCAPPWEKLKDQVQRALVSLGLEPSVKGRVFLASDGQQPTSDANLVRDFGAVRVDKSWFPAGSNGAIMLDTFLCTQSDVFIGSAFSSISDFVRGLRLWALRKPIGTNLPYTHIEGRKWDWG